MEFHSRAALIENADWLKALFLNGTTQSPLAALRVDVDASFINWLNTGGASPCMILYIRQECEYLIRFSQCNNLYFN